MATIDKYLKVRKGVDTPDVLTSSATVYHYFKTPVVYFNTASPAPITVGGMAWDDGEGTLSLGLKGGNVNLQLGQENIALCYNGTASTIPNGTVVYISGAEGQKPSINLASALSEEGSSKVFGVTTENIPSGAEGFVATFGIVNGINTSTFSEGAALWLSASSGKMTTSKPLSPAHLVFVGYCLKVNSSSGRILVNPQNGYEIEELHDVLVQTASNNHILSYNSASSLWMNKDLQAAIKEVDGPGSEIDADLLDGQQGSFYMPSSASNNFVISLTASNTYLRRDIASATYGIIEMSTSEPLNPVDGTLWIDTDSDVTSDWARVIFATEQPSNPQNGVLWVDSDSNIDTDISSYAKLNSPAFTGIPTAPTASVGTNTTQIATTAFVYSMLTGIDGGTPQSTYDYTIDGGSV